MIVLLISGAPGKLENKNIRITRLVSEGPIVCMRNQVGAGKFRASYWDYRSIC